MDIYQSIPAYVYKITCNPTGQFYYGYRERNITNHKYPHEDLWVEYFTSSKLISNLLSQYGKDKFTTEIIFTSTNRLDAYWIEQSYIQQHWTNALLLNKHFIDPVSKRKAFRATKETAAKATLTKRSRGTDKLGGAKTLETLKNSGKLRDRALKSAATKRKNGTDKLSVEKSIKTRKANGNDKIGTEKMVRTRIENGSYITGAAKTAELRRIRGTDKIGAVKSADKNSHFWEVINPEGMSSVIKNLSKFCRDNELHVAAMCRITISGRCHKGWKCNRIQ
jgi:hypothetical protein